MTITSSDFLPKDRDAALKRVKDELYARIIYHSRYLIAPAIHDSDYEQGHEDGCTETHIVEAEYLRTLIDMIERS